MPPFLRPLVCAVAFLAPLAGHAQPKPIVIGQTYVQTGPLAALGVEPLMGIRAMLASVNGSGGIHGSQIALEQLDDAYDAARAEQNVKQLASGGAVAILMPIGTTSSVGALKAANDLKIPLIAPYTGAGPVVKFSEYGFPVRISFDEEYGRIVNHLFTVGITRIAFAHNDNPGARSAMESTKKFIQQRGSEMAGSVAIQNDGSDAEAKAQELAKFKPTAVVLSATNSVTAKFIKAYRATGAEARFYSFSFLSGQQLHKDIGADAVGVVVSQVVPYPWSPTLPVIAQYQAAMKKMGNAPLSYGSFEGYVSAKVLLEAIKRAGPSPTPEAVKRALESFKSWDLGGMLVRYAPGDHQGLTFSELSMVKKDGGFVR